MIRKYIIKWLSRSVFNFQEDSVKKLYRTLEKQSKKLISTNLHLLFNETCIKENLLPTYNDLYI